jgi:hypothetical protein
MRASRPVKCLSRSRTMGTVCLRAFSTVAISRHDVKVLLPTYKNCPSNRQTGTRTQQAPHTAFAERKGGGAGGRRFAWPMVLSMPVEGCLSLCAGLLLDLRAWCHYPHQTPALVLVSSCLQNWVRPKDAQMLQQTQETFTLCCHILTVSRTTTTVTKTLGYSRKFV